MHVTRRGRPCQAKDARKRRVGVRLLILLWIWAACVFLILDLFFNVGALDSIRPRSRSYRAVRFAAHELAGERYEESDEFCALRRSSADSAASVGATEHAFRQQLRRVSSEHGGDPTLTLPAAFDDRPDLSRIPPPPQFRGTLFEWRLKGRVSTEDLAHMLKAVGSLSGQEKQTLLNRVRRTPHRALARPLAECREAMGDWPDLLACYGMAGSAILATFRPAGEGHTDAQELSDRDRAAADTLLGQVIECILRQATRYRAYFGESGWEMIRSVCRDVTSYAPDIDTFYPHSLAWAEFRTAVADMLRTATEPRAGYRGGVAAVRLASDLFDPAMAEVLLDLVRCHGSVARKLAPRPSEEYFAFLDVSCGALADKGSAEIQSRLASLLADAIANSSGSPEVSAHLAQLARGLGLTHGRSNAGHAPALEAAIAAAEDRDPKRKR